MGFFDGLRKDKKQAEPVQQEQRVQEDAVEDEIAIEHIEVVERDPHSSTVPEPQPVESRPEIEPTPIRSYRDKKPVKHVVGQTKIMAIINQKGGVGKTTTCANLGIGMAREGKRVLLVDCDPQASLTLSLGWRKPETLPGAVAFSMLDNLAVVLIAPALPCPVRNQVSVEKPDWSTVPFIMADQGPVRRRIELWFRRQKISNPSIYATVSGHEAMVSMVALGCGVALLPEVVLDNSPEPVRNRVMILERSDEKTPFELGVCAQKKRLHEPLIDAFWTILPNH